MSNQNDLTELKKELEETNDYIDLLHQMKPLSDTGREVWERDVAQYERKKAVLEQQIKNREGR